MPFSWKAIPDTLRSIAEASITNAYQTLGTSLGHCARLIRFVNNTDGDMFISLDGSNNHFFVAKASFVLYDLAANACSPMNKTPFVFASGTQFYIKYSSAPSIGTFYIEVIYALGE